MRLPVVALVGRPNVGKSTLFNRLTGRRIAIVEDEPGTTRDRLYAPAEWAGRAFIVVDTGGLDVGVTERAPGRGTQTEALAEESRDFAREIRQQAEVAIEQADAVILLTDARDGITAADRDVADLLRRSGRPVLLVVNKADNEARRQATFEFHELGLGEPWPVSALHGTGTGDMLDAMVQLIPPAEDETVPGGVGVAIVGRPNVGKSSLLNALLGQDRAIVSPIPGTTRDAVDTALRFDGRDVVLIDTAGIRRRGKVEPGVEKYSVLRAIKAIQRAEVVLLILDATTGVTAQDTHVAGFVLEAFRSVAVIVNKWDAVADKDGGTMATFTSQVREKLRFLDYVPVLFVSALTRQRVDRILPLALRIADQRQARVPTAELNRILREAWAAHAAPNRRGKPVRFLYGTQAEVAPPTFILFVSDPELVHFSYARYLENRLRAAHPFEGTPLRIVFRKRE